MGKPELEWDSETVGCSPSLSSIVAKDQRLFRDALEEIMTWMKQPANVKEMVVLYLDDQPDLEDWKKVDTLLDQVKQMILPFKREAI